MLFILSSLLNTIWIFTWHYGLIEVSALLIIGVLLSLILINNITRKVSLGLKNYIFIRLPFSVYFGWLTVATIANITTMLVKIGFNGFGISEAIWTVIVIIVGLIIASLTIMRNIDIAYGLTIVWAYAGIYIKHISKDGWNANYSSVIFASVASIVILVMVMVYTLLNKRKNSRKIRDI